jgi:hypothetical protein
LIGGLAAGRLYLYTTPGFSPFLDWKRFFEGLASRQVLFNFQVRLMRNRLFILAALGLAFGLSSIGCGSKEGVMVGRLVPVKGTVSYKGKLVTKGTVQVEPDAGRSASGEIQSDGTFVLTTFKHGDGVVAGTHKLTVAAPKSQVPPRRKNASEMEIEVVEGKSDYPVEIR